MMSGEMSDRSQAIIEEYGAESFTGKRTARNYKRSYYKILQNYESEEAFNSYEEKELRKVSK